MALAAYIPKKSNVRGYWKLEDINDSGANGYTLTNNGSCSFVAGKDNNAVDFGSSNSSKSLSIANNCGISNSDCSASMWVNPYATTMAGDHPIIFLTYDNVGVAFGLFQMSTGIGALRLKPAVSWGDTTQETVTASTWTHFGFSYNTSGSVLTLYKNGVASYTNNESGVGGTGYSDITIMGNGFGGGGVYWNGKLDEVILWDSLLTDAEWLQVYSMKAKTGGAFLLFLSEAYQRHKKLWTPEKKLILPKDLGFSY